MKKLILTILFIGYFLSFSSIKADYPPQKAQNASISDLIAYYGEIYNVTPKTLYNTIKCESSFSTTAHNHTWKENSYGLSQINLKAHPEIKKSQALDPDFSVQYMAKNISEGKGKMWTCYKSS